MDYDITESMMSSWLRYVRDCQIVETNWHYVNNPDDAKEINEDAILIEMKKRYKTNDQNITMLKDVEIDCLGLSIKDNVINFYIVETAFHNYTLKYKNNKDSIKGKCVRSLMSLYRLNKEMNLKDKMVNINFIFASPKVGDKEIKKIDSSLKYIERSYNELLNDEMTITIDTIMGEKKFEEKIIKPLLDKSKKSKYMNNNDNSAVFLRACKLLDSINYIKRE